MQMYNLTMYAFSKIRDFFNINHSVYIYISYVCMFYFPEKTMNLELTGQFFLLIILSNLSTCHRKFCKYIKYCKCMMVMV